MRMLVDRLRRPRIDGCRKSGARRYRIGSQIRRLLLDPANTEMAAMTELLLMFASRTQAAAEIIVPALERGDVVVSDRFTDSSLAYQGFAREIGREAVMALHNLTLGSLMPDLTIALELDLETGLQRAFQRNQANEMASAETRIDRQSLDFHAKVASGYRQIATSDPARFRLVDGKGDPAEVAARVWAEAERMLRI